jgi:hypothetical protein
MMTRDSPWHARLLGSRWFVSFLEVGDADERCRGAVAIVDHIEDPQWLEREAAALGASHIGYGVTPEMHEWVGDALIATIAEACGEHWSPAADQPGRPRTRRSRARSSGRDRGCRGSRLILEAV